MPRAVAELLVKIQSWCRQINCKIVVLKVVKKLLEDTAHNYNKQQVARKRWRKLQMPSHLSWSHMRYLGQSKSGMACFLEISTRLRTWSSWRLIKSRTLWTVLDDSFKINGQLWESSIWPFIGSMTIASFFLMKMTRLHLRSRISSTRLLMNISEYWYIQLEAKVVRVVWFVST